MPFKISKIYQDILYNLLLIILFDQNDGQFEFFRIYLFIFNMKTLDI
jgi:hypothetical protein